MADAEVDVLETELPEDWQTDMVITELRRAYPAGLSKGVLEERTGMGPGALRTVVAYLEEDGQIAEASAGESAGWRYLEVEERPIGPVPQEATESDGDPDGGDDTGEPLGEAENAAEGAGELPERLVDTPYSAVIQLRVIFYPEPIEPETNDQGSLREARDILSEAVDGILASYPDLTVETDLTVLAYDRPRRVG